MTNETIEKLEAVLHDEKCVKALGEAKDVATVKAVLLSEGIEVDDAFALALIEKRDAVLAAGELKEDDLEMVAGGRGFKGALIGAGFGAAAGGLAAGGCGAVFGAFLGAIVGGLG